MADIDVVQKRSGSRAWLWLVVALIALAIILFLMMGTGTEEMTNPGQRPLSAVPATAAAGWMT